MHPLVRWLSAVAFVATLALGLQSAWAELAPAVVRSATTVLLAVFAIGWIVLRLLDWLVGDDLEGEALRSSRRP